MTTNNQDKPEFTPEFKPSPEAIRVLRRAAIAFMAAKRQESLQSDNQPPLVQKVNPAFDGLRRSAGRLNAGDRVLPI